MALLSKLGKSLTRISSSRGAMIGIGALGVTGGILSKAAPAAKDAALEAAFGDANADVYFTGRDLDARFLVGTMMGGVGGGILQASAPGDFIAANPIAGGAAIGATTIGGAAVGGYLGNFLGRGGVRGTIATAGGTMAGGLIGAIGGISGRLRNNSTFYSQSPYSSSRSSSLQTMQALNATGDVVLGMHNSRRGY